jgi:hypothetical protein
MILVSTNKYMERYFEKRRSMEKPRGRLENAINLLQIWNWKVVA